MSDTKTLTFTRTVNAPAAQVYRAFTNAQGFQEWFSDVAETDPRERGRVYLWWATNYYVSGQFVHLEENHKVAFTWLGLGDAAPSRVRVQIDEQGWQSTVTLFHDDVAPASTETASNDWSAALDNLVSVLDTGVDKRLYDRPMLGFFIGGMVDENLKKRLGLPVDFGVHVAGVIDGMGAQKSGLQAEDVIAVIDGREIRQFPDIRQALGNHKGGDHIPAAIYRGPEMLTLDVELSRRPIPAYPPIPAELAKIGEATYRDLMGELRAALAGVTEEEASHRPGPGEWNAREVMAHLLVGERTSHAAWDLHPAGGKLPEFPGSTRLAEAIGQTYATGELFTELEQGIQVNMHLIRSLPEEFVANRGAYFLVANDFEEGLRRHFGEHLTQLKAAIESARAGLASAG